MSIGMTIVLILLCILVQGFFSGSELALVSADRLKLRGQADDGHKGAIQTLQLLERPEWLLGTCLIGTNLCVVTSTTLASMQFSRFGPEGAIYTALALTPMVLIFGEMVPKSVYEHHADRLAPLVVRPIYFVSRVVRPVLFLLTSLSRLLLRVTNAPPSAIQRPVSREEILLLLEAVEHGDIAESEKELIIKVFEFGDITVEEAMVPLIHVVAVPESTTVLQAAQRMVETGLSRLPIYRDRVDRICGLVTHRDLLFAANLDDPISKYLRTVPFVPESKSLEALFTELRVSRQRLAVVVDEYGGATGIISIEDIIEEIVGEIEDEFDKEAASIRHTGDHQWTMEGRVERNALEKHINLLLPEGDFETLAGFLLVQVGRIPIAGEQIKWGEWKFTIAKANERAILEVVAVRAARKR